MDGTEGGPRLSMSLTECLSVFEPTDASSSWKKLSGAVCRDDIELVRRYAEDMEGILIFASFFSAVLIAFLVQSCHLSQRDALDTTTMMIFLLLQEMVENTTVGPLLAFINSTGVPTSQHWQSVAGASSCNPFVDLNTNTNRSAAVDILWLASLVLALVGASCGVTPFSTTENADGGRRRT
ncbi:hypothetical protein BC835DRAFT_1410088 [Cytidiella melzeri]|nr:hypothetical protein BC835DRAFT_1410088 [Cytidiella melzeri]